jgi:hypothetical protein
VPDTPLNDMLRRLTVLEGYTYRGLTVFPVGTSKVMDSTDYASMPEALDDKALVITEKDGGSVPILVGENRGDHPILMVAGEVLAGGRQNRTLSQDVLLPAHSGRIELPVLCVERGRWSGSDFAFGKASSVAGLNVRAVAQAGRSQDEVWSGVSNYQRQLAVPSRTEDMQAVSDSPEVRGAMADYRSAFAPRWPHAPVGMVVARYGRIVGADVFCNAEVFRKHRDRLLESYALDCYAGREEEGAAGLRHIPPEPGRLEAERFLNRVQRAEQVWAPTAGAGRLLKVHGAGVNGMALVHDEAVLHAGLFAEDIVRPLPPPPPIIRPMPQE